MEDGRYFATLRQVSENIQNLRESMMKMKE